MGIEGGLPETVLICTDLGRSLADFDYWFKELMLNLSLPLPPPDGVENQWHL